MATKNNDIIWDDEQEDIVWDDEKPKAPATPYAAVEGPQTETVIRHGWDAGTPSPTEGIELPQNVKDYYLSALNDPNIPLGEININMRRMLADQGRAGEFGGEIFDPAAAEAAREASRLSGKPIQGAIQYESGIRALEGLRPETLENPEERSDVGLMAEEGLLFNPMNVIENWRKDITDSDINSSINKENIAQAFPDASEEQIEEIHDSLIGDDLRRQRTAVSRELDNRSTGLGFEAARMAIGLPTGASPADLIPFAGRGASLAMRGMGAVASNQAIDAAMQAGDIAYGAQEDFSNTQNLFAGLAGAGFHAGLESIGYGIRRVLNKGVDSRGVYIEVVTTEGDTKKVYRGEEGVVEDVQAAEGSALEGQEVPSFLKTPVKAKGYDGKTKPSGKSEPRVVGTDARDAAARVEQIAGQWKNAPDFLIVNNVDDLDPKLEAEITADAAEGALGVTLPDGRVLLMTDNIKTPDQLDAVVYHEALGHYGLHQQYGEGLQDLLTRMDDGNENLRADVDAWIERKGWEGERHVAVEEVLAELSEEGTLDRSLLNSLKLFLSRMAERAGFTKRNFSDGEVLEILRQGQQRVVAGERNAATLPGMRYIREGRGDIDEAAAWKEDRAEIETEIREIDDDLRVVTTREEADALYRMREEAVQELRELADESPSDSRFLSDEDLAPNAQALNPPRSNFNNNLTPEFESALFSYANARSIRPSKLIDELEKGTNPEAEAEIAAMARAEGGDTLYSADDATRLMEQAEENPGRVQFSRMWPHNRNIVDFRFVDPETGNEIYGAFRQRGDKATDLEVYGAGRNTGGPRVVREIRKQIKEEFPEITKLTATRTSGARNKGQSVPVTEGQEVELRFMRDTEREPSKLKRNPGKQKQRGMIGNVSGNRFKSKQAVHPIIKEAAELSPELTRDSFAEINRRAKEVDVDLEDIANKGLKPEEAHAVGVALITKSEQVTRLAKTIEAGDASDYQMTKFMESFLELSSIYETYSQIANDAGRLLASFKIAKQSSSNAALRFMTDDTIKAVGQLPDDASNVGAVRSLTKAVAEGTTTPSKLVKESPSISALSNALNLPRTLMSSADLSAALRQAVVLSTTRNYWKNFVQMFKYIGSQDAFDAVQYNIVNDPNYMKMREAGVDFTTTEGKHAANLEEDFQSEWGKGKWAKKFGIGHVVEGSERAFVGFLNKLRADTFNQYMKDWEKAGYDINDPELLKWTGDFINAATGRGPMPKKLLGSTPLLNGMFFSPRLNTSRAALLSPYYLAAPAPVRKAYIRNMTGFVGLAFTTISLLSLAGADVETDPRSSDFGKIRIGTRRYDVLGGFGQFITLYSRLMTGETKTIKGDVRELNSGEYKSDTRLDVFFRFARNKSSPIASFFWDAMDGQNSIGDRFSVTEPFTDPPEGEDPVPFNKNAIVTRLTPIYVQDVFESLQQDGILGPVWTIPAVFGIGYSDFDSVPSDSPLREENNPDDPVVKEVIRLATVGGKNPFGNPSRRANLEGDGQGARNMTDTEWERYQQIADQYILEDVGSLIQSEDYELASDEEKAEMMNKLVKQSRKDARATLADEFFGDGAITWDE